jgi:hypothetical protein
MENLRGEFIRHTRKEREELRSYLEQFRSSGSRTYTNRRKRLWSTLPASRTRYVNSTRSLPWVRSPVGETYRLREVITVNKCPAPRPQSPARASALTSPPFAGMLLFPDRS